MNNSNACNIYIYLFIYFIYREYQYLKAYLHSSECDSTTNVMTNESTKLPQARCFGRRPTLRRRLEHQHGPQTSETVAATSDLHLLQEARTTRRRRHCRKFQKRAAHVQQQHLQESMQVDIENTDNPESMDYSSFMNTRTSTSDRRNQSVEQRALNYFFHLNKIFFFFSYSS